MLENFHCYTKWFLLRYKKKLDVCAFIISFLLLRRLLHILNSSFDNNPPMKFPRKSFWIVLYFCCCVTTDWRL